MLAYARTLLARQQRLPLAVSTLVVVTDIFIVFGLEST